MTTAALPRPGALATLRNRRGLITQVEPFDGSTEGRVHLVSVEYVDADGVHEDTVVWECEPSVKVLEPAALPDVIGESPMAPDEFDALVRATRWTALSPYIDADAEGPLDRLPVSSPFHGAIQVEDFQLVPLLKALRMPRVALLLADDVGLGKTVEAGLILAELLQRRRVRRVLILCPASLRRQWQQEMRQKFSLAFDIIDRRATHDLQRRLGLDANPWRTFPRIITSYDYLKQDDVLEQFRAACRQPEGSPHLPWDLLVVDEAHNLSPASFGEDSDVSRMLRLLSPWFEHRLFLTATPHNGHTRSFTGLLEYLDPVRFTRKGDALTANERTRVEQVVVRRLKREINDRTDPPRFANRDLDAIPLKLSAAETRLSSAFADFRTRVRSVIGGSRTERIAGMFAVEILGKRLLSCPVTFADSWYRYGEGLSDEPASAEEVRGAERAVAEETSDDTEAESRIANAAHTVGSWLKPLADRLQDEMAAIQNALADLGLEPSEARSVDRDPTADARFDALLKLIGDRLRDGKRFRTDERIVVFTEYKTTLDYVVRRLRAKFPDDGVVRELYGDLDDAKRDLVKSAFNDPTDPVRILVATDAAAEGLNLQETARYLLHYDVPWNPSRLEQRNGRLDRHGQARDVTVYHFTTDDDADVAFLAHVVGKVHTIREDLGSMGDVFDAAIERRLLGGEAVRAVQVELDKQLEAARGRAIIPRTEDIEMGEEEYARLEALAAEVDLDPDTLRTTLDVALGLEIGRPRLEGPDGRGRFRLKAPLPPRWEGIIDDTLRLGGGGVAHGALPKLLFDSRGFLKLVGKRPVFIPEKDTALLHLGHPLFQQALALFARTRFPGGAQTATRWTVRRGEVPAGADALLLVTVEELATNELRETFHHWVRTLRIPVRKGGLGESLPHVPARGLGSVNNATAATAPAREIWDEVARDVRTLLATEARSLTERVKAALVEDGKRAEAEEAERYRSRQGEVSALIAETTLQRIEREIAQLRTEAAQGLLFDRDQKLAEIERSAAEKEEEVKRLRAHYEELRQQLDHERERVLRHLIPRRYALRGDAQVFPVAVEIRLPPR